MTEYACTDHNKSIADAADDLALELQKIYNSEINVSVSWFWDGGINLRLGDEINGYEAEETVRTVAEIVPWLQEATAHFYPTSMYAQSLDPQVIERAGRRLFLPPRTNARAVCPHCGALHSVPFLDELLAFVCSHCGNSVKVDPPKVQ